MSANQKDLVNERLGNRDLAFSESGDTNGNLNDISFRGQGRMLLECYFFSTFCNLTKNKVLPVT